MKIVLSKNISCLNAAICTQKIRSILEKKYGVCYDQKTNKASWHFSVYHENGNHKIWLIFYDKNGVHESDYHGKLRTQKSENIIKYSGPKPTLEEVKKIKFNDTLVPG